MSFDVLCLHLFMRIVWSYCLPVARSPTSIPSPKCCPMFAFDRMMLSLADKPRPTRMHRRWMSMRSRSNRWFWQFALNCSGVCRPVEVLKEKHLIIVSLIDKNMIINFLFAGLIGHVVNLMNEEKKHRRCDGGKDTLIAVTQPNVVRHQVKSTSKSVSFFYFFRRVFNRLFNYACELLRGKCQHALKFPCSSTHNKNSF